MAFTTFGLQNYCLFLKYTTIQPIICVFSY